jgi:hypothetical protein
MFIATAIVSSLLACALVLSAQAKLAHKAAVMTVMASVGVPAQRVWLLACAEMAGAAGLIAGLFIWPLGVAAAVGVVLYFVGAVSAHLRKYNLKIAPASVLLLWGVAALVLRTVSN